MKNLRVHKTFNEETGQIDYRVQRETIEPFYGFKYWRNCKVFDSSIAATRYLRDYQAFLDAEDS